MASLGVMIWAYHAGLARVDWVSRLYAILGGRELSHVLCLGYGRGAMSKSKNAISGPILFFLNLFWWLQPQVIGIFLASSKPEATTKKRAWRYTRRVGGAKLFLVHFLE